ncbi:hypothetical protein KXD40_007086 [Peronospora effusa]|uniref:Uncharacterized protein n=1 Tax=Peronospora effusa TaxID=542832 RepID=A0A3R7Y9R9_9STRA|nr:hypothetical protein DD237_003454 [Peronospora effusa]UIZ24821.1 hypothetical protein KXD40_007086 [Peronospora effusa]
MKELSLVATDIEKAVFKRTLKVIYSAKLSTAVTVVATTVKEAVTEMLALLSGSAMLLPGSTMLLSGSAMLS